MNPFLSPDQMLRELFDLGLDLAHYLPRILRVRVHARLRVLTRVRVRVFCHPGPIPDHYEPGTPLVLAYTGTLTAERGTTDHQILRRVYAMFNDAPTEPGDAEHTRAWYDSGLRSLSVGDVVALDDRHYACEPTGWSAVPAP